MTKTTAGLFDFKITQELRTDIEEKVSTKQDRKQPGLFKGDLIRTRYSRITDINKTRPCAPNLSVLQQSIYYYALLEKNIS